MKVLAFSFINKQMDILRICLKSPQSFADRVTSLDNMF